MLDVSYGLAVLSRTHLSKRSYCSAGRHAQQLINKILAEWAPIVLLGSASACSSIPLGRAAVVQVRYEGTSKVNMDGLAEKLVTRPSPKFLGLWSGVVFDYQLFDRVTLERDLERVERFYRVKGYYQARARAGRVETVAPDKVRVTVVVEEGEPVKVRRSVLLGIDTLPVEQQDEIRNTLPSTVRPSHIFDEENFKEAEQAIQTKLTDMGYAWAKVERSAQVDVPHGYADLQINVTPGKPAVLGTISIEGLGPLPDEPIRRALELDPDSLYSSSALATAQQAVLNLGVFEAVEVVPNLEESEGTSGTVPICVKLKLAKLRYLRLGGGVELDVIRTDIHVKSEWTDRNFFGGMRDLRVSLRSGLVFYPIRVDQLNKLTHLLPEGKIAVELRQPGFVEARTRGILQTETGAAPILPLANVNVDSLLGYWNWNGAIGAERNFGPLSARILYNIQTSVPFTYFGPLEPGFRSVIISYPSLTTEIDLRDDPIYTKKGVFLSNELQVAGGLFGGDTQDIRIQPEARAYFHLAKPLVLAVRGTVGFLFPSDYDQTITDGTQKQNDRKHTRDLQLNYFRAFFSGGPNSNRGYPFRGITPPWSQLYDRGVSCLTDPSEPDCQFPMGGLSMWEASAELRVTVYGPLFGVGFCDASDVSLRRFSIDFRRPHLSCGLGIRYDTPVGPLRLDIGYRIHGLQNLDTNDSPEVPPPTIFGLPIAFAVGIGEAF